MINRIKAIYYFLFGSVISFLLSAVFSQERAFFLGLSLILGVAFILFLTYTTMEFIIAREHPQVWRLGFIGLVGLIGLVPGLTGFFAFFAFFAFFGAKDYF